jgi:hypothetical protein
MTRPEQLETEVYVDGVDTLNDVDAWSLFKACAMGDMPKGSA